MVGRCARDLARLRWSPATVARFLGCWLSEPKPTVIFAAPPRPRPRAAFARALAKAGARLDRRTQLLYDRHHLFINGSALAWPADAANALALRRLANARRIDARTAAALPADGIALLHRWYCDGYLETPTG
jgi:50S ribosomal protein L16 3-hydroxylase